MPKPRSAAPGGTSQRQLRVGELIRHALSDVLTRAEVPDPVLEKHVITVPEVRMSPDLKLATAYVMPLGGRDEAAVIKALDKNRKILRQEVARRVNLKFAPDLRFLRDESFDEAARIDALLRTERVARDTGRPGPAVSEDNNDEQDS
jgi:ribosome-binding factor A